MVVYLSYYWFLASKKPKATRYVGVPYQLIEYRPGDLVRLDVKINYEDAPPLATIVDRDAAQLVDRDLRWTPAGRRCLSRRVVHTTYLITTAETASLLHTLNKKRKQQQ
jgi:translation elongation factor EF-4